MVFPVLSGLFIVFSDFYGIMLSILTEEDAL